MLITNWFLFYSNRPDKPIGTNGHVGQGSKHSKLSKKHCWMFNAWGQKEKKKKGKGDVSSSCRQRFLFISLFLIDIFGPCLAPGQTCHLVALDILNPGPGSREALWYENGMGKKRRETKVGSVREEGSFLSFLFFPFFLLS